MIRLPRLYAVADEAFGDPVQLAKALFDGGATLVQIRHKSTGAGVLIREVDEVLKFAPRNAQVIVNDRPDVARVARATGVHLGQEDLPASLARLVLKKTRLSDAQHIPLHRPSMRRRVRRTTSPSDPFLRLPQNRMPPL